MSGITSGVGVFSGVNRDQIISQLLAIDGRPKAIAAKRVTQLQGLQAAYLDVNSKISGLRSAAQAFNLNSIFRSSKATSSNADLLGATAGPGAAPGTYSFIVDRLVSTQQSLSGGFVNSNTDGIGLTKLTIESAQARLDRDTDLSQLNGGAGISRGKITLTDSSGGTAIIDLSRVATVNDILTTINSTTGIRVNARVEGDKFVITDTAGGGGTLNIANVTGSTTATSLGIAGSAIAGQINGSRVNTIGNQTTLSSLNGGLGVSVTSTSGLSSPDFRITTRAGNSYDIDIGDIYETVSGTLKKTKSAVTDLAGVVQRINEQSAGSVTASIDATTNALKIVDNSVPDSGGNLIISDIAGQTTATDLGLVASTSGDTITGSRLNASLNSTLARNLRGGQGVVGDGNFDVSLSDGTNLGIKLDSSQSVADIISLFNTAAAGKASLELSASGTGFSVKDLTVGAGQLNISGDGAITLGFATGPTAAKTVSSSRSQLKYLGNATRLDSLNSGAGIGTGSFEIIDSYGQRKTVNIGADNATLGDLIRTIQNASPDITARLNDNGDGLVIQEKTRVSGSGGQKITIKDLSGNVAKSLNLVGTSSTVGVDNKVDGSLERVLTFAATDSLEAINTKINQASALVNGSIVNDGSGGRPFRLSLTAKQTGLAGAFILDTEGADLGFTTVSEARNSRAFYGSTDAARGVLFSSTTNTITGAIDKVTVDLKGVSSSPVTVTVTRDSAAVETGITALIDAFNALVGSIDGKATYDKESNKRGILLGDATSSSLRAELFSTITGPALGISGRFRSLAEVGISVKTGKLSLDSTKLQQALATDPQAVADLLAAKTATSTPTTTQTPVIGSNGQIIPGAFTNTVASGTFATLGVFERVAALADRYINATDGVFARQNKSMNDQIKSQNDRIASIDASLARRKDVLTRQFLVMESTIGKLQSQSGALSQIARIT